MGFFSNRKYPQLSSSRHGWPWRLVLKLMVTTGIPWFKINLNVSWNKFAWKFRAFMEICFHIFPWFSMQDSHDHGESTGYGCHSLRAATVQCAGSNLRHWSRIAWSDPGGVGFEDHSPLGLHNITWYNHSLWHLWWNVVKLPETPISPENTWAMLSYLGHRSSTNSIGFFMICLG